MDAFIVQWLTAFHGRNGRADVFFAYAASYSSWFFAAAFFAAVFSALYFRKKERLELFLAAMFIPAVTLFFNYAVRSLVQRRRPFEVIEGLAPLVSHPPGNSFPSNHAAAGFAVACFIYMVKPSAGIVFLVLSILVSFSRVYAGLHYPSDVLAGMVLAGVVSVVIGRRKGAIAAAAQRSLRSGNKPRAE